MESLNPEFALYGSKNKCARTNTAFFPTSQASTRGVTLYQVTKPQSYQITKLPRYQVSKVGSEEGGDWLTEEDLQKLDRVGPVENRPFTN